MASISYTLFFLLWKWKKYPSLNPRPTSLLILWISSLTSRTLLPHMSPLYPEPLHSPYQIYIRPLMFRMFYDFSEHPNTLLLTISNICYLHSKYIIDSFKAGVKFYSFFCFLYVHEEYFWEQSACTNKQVNTLFSIIVCYLNLTCLEVLLHSQSGETAFSSQLNFGLGLDTLSIIDSINVHFSKQ